jgi:hypothetical protein
MPRVVAAQVEAALARYLADPDAEPRSEEVRRWAAHYHALPLFEDFMGGWALRPSGELVFFPWEEPAALITVSDAPDDPDAGVRHGALGYGSRRHPDVAGIAPERPAGARACTQCDGTGRLRDVDDVFVCPCGGLGWLPPGA